MNMLVTGVDRSLGSFENTSNRLKGTSDLSINNPIASHNRAKEYAGNGNSYQGVPLQSTGANVSYSSMQDSQKLPPSSFAQIQASTSPRSVAEQGDHLKQQLFGTTEGHVEFMIPMTA